MATLPKNDGRLSEKVEDGVPAESKTQGRSLLSLKIPPQEMRRLASETASRPVQHIYSGEDSQSFLEIGKLIVCNADDAKKLQCASSPLSDQDPFVQISASIIEKAYQERTGPGKNTVAAAMAIPFGSGVADKAILISGKNRENDASYFSGNQKYQTWAEEDTIRHEGAHLHPDDLKISSTGPEMTEYLACTKAAFFGIRQAAQRGETAEYLDFLKKDWKRVYADNHVIQSAGNAILSLGADKLQYLKNLSDQELSSLAFSMALAVAEQT